MLSVASTVYMKGAPSFGEFLRAACGAAAGVRKELGACVKTELERAVMAMNFCV